MKRRQAIRGIGGVFGYTIAAPTVLSILQSCGNRAYTDWDPQFFGESEGHLFARILDTILPETETPDATGMGVHFFIDRLFQEALPADEKELAEKTTRIFMDKVRELTGREELKDVTDEEIVKVLKVYLAKRPPEVEEAHEEALMDYITALENGEMGELNSEVACYYWAVQIRNLAIEAYKESEKIGEEYLVYKPIPGEYIKCGDLDELTGGRAYSLGS